MRKLLFVAVCFTAVFTVKMSAQGASKWSAFQGKMNWTKANAKCTSLGMRLPARKEFKAAFDANLTLDWSKNGAVYWTSDLKSKEAAHVFVISYGVESNYQKVDSHGVRCIGK